MLEKLAELFDEDDVGARGRRRARREGVGAPAKRRARMQ
jgi:hypothetical protein